MLEDLKLAAKVHYAFLPEDFEDDRLRIAASVRPLYDIGGDFCSIMSLGDNHMLACVCDAGGHGIAAALFAARINTYVLTHAEAEMLPCELVEGLNAYLCKRLAGTGMYATFFAVLFDLKAGTMNLSGAGHPPVLQLENSSELCAEWPSATTLLAINDPMPVVCGFSHLQLNAGDHFLLYSDGLIEVEDADSQAFEVEGLSNSLIKHRNLTGQALNSAIIEQSESFAGNGFQDDVLLMSITIK